ncbi:AbrB/MazE/SpoVT family DNA-binding domain-containing protein [Egbenema bharatensis]|uniref:AbrB/MazE/SpoVT family DNA-binding domain-containing protein n=1 Tax=Egbenema bharatensis TaxID=3463334 RepID=UPI003A876654
MRAAKVTCAKWGNGLAIQIPQSLAQKLQITEGSEVDCFIADGSLVLRPKRKPYSLDELVEQITSDNLHAEVETDIAVGNEVW